MTVSLSAPLTQSDSLQHKHTRTLTNGNDRSNISLNDQINNVCEIDGGCVCSHMPTCERCVFVDVGVCVGVGPSMSTRGILGKIWHLFIII